MRCGSRAGSLRCRPVVRHILPLDGREHALSRGADSGDLAAARNAPDRLEAAVTDHVQVVVQVDGRVAMAMATFVFAKVDATPIQRAEAGAEMERWWLTP